MSSTRSLTIELVKYDFTVNCRAPGLIDTPLLRAEAPEVMERPLLAPPTGTLGAAADVAFAAQLLAGPRARVITGQVLYALRRQELLRAAGGGLTGRPYGSLRPPAR